MYRALILFVIFSFISCNRDYHGTLLIYNAEIYDGTGNPSITGNIVLNNSDIVAFGQDVKCSSCEVLDVQGKSVAPGFIDLHAHLEPLPIIPAAESALRMGVTTALGGPDGGSPIRLDYYLDSLKKIQTGINVAYLIGHNSIRNNVMGLEGRAPSEVELDSMKILAEIAMREGAFGISTGLKYLPGSFAKTDEIVEISKVIASKGGIYTSHLREEGLGLIEGVSEAIQISDDANIPVVLTHHKAIGQPMWGASLKTLAMVDSARNIGLDIYIDQYPYTASYTSFSVLIPAWAMEGGRYTKFAERCKNPEIREKIKQGIIDNIINDRGGGDLKRIQIARFNYKPEFEGKTLYDWAIAEGLEPTPDNGAELIIEAQLNRGGSAIYHAMDEKDVERIMGHPYTMIASDGRVTEFEKGFPHPRVYGTFPRVLGYYSRERQLLPLEEAIRKMTSLPAHVLGLNDRGKIDSGYKADLVIFDKEKIIDKATFEKPHQFPEGISHVIINGRFAIKGGILDTNRHGEILRGPSYLEI